MSSNAATTQAQSTPSAASERHRLLSFNRRLRHLQGISLRNLDLDPPTGRPKGATTDDEALPYALKSPVKLLAEQEREQLVHSKSFEILKPQQDIAKEWSGAGTSASAGARQSSVLSSSSNMKRPRRKSTLEWSSSTPAERTESLRKAVERRTADVFITLHCAQTTKPIYVSELVENAMNPDFCAFDLRACHASISRLDCLTVRVWAFHAGQWLLLLEEASSLAKLDYLGRSLASAREELPDNCLVYHLPDGVYARLTDDSQEDTSASTALLDVGPLSVHAEKTSSYDSLMRLATLDECIQDALAIRVKLVADINALIEKNKASFFGAQRLQDSKSRLNKVRRAINTERQNVESIGNNLQQQRSLLDSRRKGLSQESAAMSTARSELSSEGSQLGGWREARGRMLEDITSQRRRICSDLCDVYPVEPIPKKPLAFTIRSLPLPHADFTGVQEDPTSAALGFVAHLVYVLSLYLAVPLPYPITFSGSTSTIKDPISNMADDRTFPLYMPKTVFFRFEYGVFLLNKNIELLATRLGLRVIDIRQILPNLKYILFVATAGKGELPRRKAGGVRSLVLRDEEKATPDSSRRSSFEGSDAVRGALQKQLSPVSADQNGHTVKPNPHHQRQAV